MADVTINNLPDLAVTGTSFLAHTNGVTTGRATVDQLKTALNVTSQVNSDWNATSGVAQILNKPAVGISGIQFFRSGTSNFVVPVGVTKLKITVVGGGGGGGAGSGTCNGAACLGGSGASGGHAISLVNVSPGQNYSVTVGGGGTGGGGGGGTSSFSGNNINVYATGGGSGTNGGRTNAFGCSCRGTTSGSPGTGVNGLLNMTGVPYYVFGAGSGPTGTNSPNTGSAGIVVVEW